MSERIFSALNEDTGAEERIGQLMRDLLARIPSGSATLSVHRGPSGMIFQLKPANRDSAAFGVHYDGCVDVFFGTGTTFELPWESGLPEDADFEAVLQWAKAMGEAVIAGKCKERAGLLGVSGTIWVNGKPFKTANFFHLRLHPTTYRYAAYSPEAC
ncbi:MAG: hypothetical protein WAN03_22095 [Candidatus Sulfotelmatobacter sp.]